jgi:hypothetical protein
MVGFFANLPVTGSLYCLFIERVADGNQEQRKQGTRNKKKNTTLDLITGAARCSEVKSLC